MKAKAVLLLLIVAPLFSLSQDLSGDWKGQIIPANPVYAIRFPVTFQIQYDSITNIITGTSRTLSPDSIYAEFRIKGSFLPELGYYHIEETDLISTNLIDKKSAVKNFFRFALSDIRGDKITGQCFCLNKEIHFMCAETLTVKLERYVLPAKDKK
jgi:hypothetical protein